MYSLEVHLVEDLKNNLNHEANPFNVTNIATEFNYLSGRVDIIAKSKTGLLIAFEAKLLKWKKALNQAYRNTSFSHFSYVVLPSSKIKLALKYDYEFLKRGVGLCSVNNEGVEIEIQALHNQPLQPWLTNLAFNYIKNE